MTNRSSQLTWGREYVMCPPEHFRVEYAINPWMGGEVDPDLAMVQWLAIGDTIRAAGGDIRVLPAVPGLPDMVFTANHGIIDGQTFIAGRMRHAERVEEVGHASTWAADAGSTVVPLADEALLEGLGDAMPLGPDGMVVGYGHRSNLAAHDELRRLTDRTVLGVELTDPRFYHVDLTLCPLDDRRAIVYPDAWDVPGGKAVMARIPEPLVLDHDQAGQFTANSIVVGSTVIMPACAPEVGRQLEAWGFDVAVVDVSEFAKAGGAIRCLTLPLDTVLSRVDDSSASRSGFAAAVGDVIGDAVADVAALTQLPATPTTPIMPEAL